MMNHARGVENRSEGGGIDVVLVTGLSGAGRGTAAKVLEDLGWYVADNLPPQLITRMVDFGLAAGSRITQLAVVMDVRSRGFTGDLDSVRNELATRAITPVWCSWRRPMTRWCAATNRIAAVIRCRVSRLWPRALPQSAGC